MKDARVLRRPGGGAVREAKPARLRERLQVVGDVGEPVDAAVRNGVARVRSGQPVVIPSGHGGVLDDQFRRESAAREYGGGEGDAWRKVVEAVCCG